MDATQHLHKNLHDILKVARLAPSVHNAQPWVVRLEENSIVISIDPMIDLRHSDPTGRETIISLGIFVEALRLGITAHELSVSSVQYRDREARVTVGLAKSTEGSTPSRLSLLRKRASDRSVYTDIPIVQETIQEIENAWDSKTVSVRVTTDRQLMNTIARLTAQGIQLALSSPSFRLELSRFLVRPWSNRKRGIATKSLYIPFFLQILEPWLMRKGIGVSQEVKLEKRRWESASAVVIIAADGDMPEYWFEAGQAYLHASLAIENSGLSQATSAAIVEASDFHEDIEKALGTNRRVLCMLRIGKGSKHRHYSPRVDTEQLLATLN